MPTTTAVAANNLVRPGREAGLQIGSCLKLAVEHGARTISFPAISTGVYGYPADDSAQIAVREVRAFLMTSEAIDAVIFVVFDGIAEEIYRRLLHAPNHP